MIDLNGPIVTFWQNCKAQGVAFGLDDDGKLSVTLPDALKGNTFFQAEIVKRAAWLKELAEMDSLMGRPLGPIDVDRLRTLAARYGYDLQWSRAELNGPDAGVWKPYAKNGDADPDWQDPAVQESIDRSYPSRLAV